MWLASQKLKAFNARQKQKGGPAAFQVKRVGAELQAAAPLALGEKREAPFSARVLLNDLTPESVQIYVTRSMYRGEELSLNLQQPRRFYVKGKVLWCRETEASGRVITAVRYTHRICLQFVFDSPQEAAEAQMFAEEIRRLHLSPNRNLLISTGGTDLLAAQPAQIPAANPFAAAPLADPAAVNADEAAAASAAIAAPEEKAA
jgi:hypothetical protein